MLPHGWRSRGAVASAAFSSYYSATDRRGPPAAWHQAASGLFDDRRPGRLSPDCHETEARWAIRILLAASEVVGFAKTGGLADVAGALPPALARRGLECAVILPLYRCARAAQPAPEPTEHTFERAHPRPLPSLAGCGARHCPTQTYLSVWSSRTTTSTATTPDDGRGLYQFTTPNGGRRDYADNCERFVFFCRAVLEALRLLDFWPDVLHVNDWQTGLVPVYLRELYRRTGSDRLRPATDTSAPCSPSTTSLTRARFGTWTCR